MSLQYTLWHLREAAEELTRLIQEVESGEVDRVGFAHLFHHLNSAWNARGAPQEACEACSEADFNRWRRFPDDLHDDFSGKADA